LLDFQQLVEQPLSLSGGSSAHQSELERCDGAQSLIISGAWIV
jgi:hypothetical protein